MLLTDKMLFTTPRAIWCQRHLWSFSEQASSNFFLIYFFCLNKSLHSKQGEMKVLTIDKMNSMVDHSGNKVRSLVFSSSVVLRLSRPKRSLGQLLEMLIPRSETWDILFVNLGWNPRICIVDKHPRWIQCRWSLDYSKWWSGGVTVHMEKYTPKVGSRWLVLESVVLITNFPSALGDISCVDWRWAVKTGDGLHRTTDRAHMPPEHFVEGMPKLLFQVAKLG